MTAQRSVWLAGATMGLPHFRLRSRTSARSRMTTGNGLSNDADKEITLAMRAVDLRLFTLGHVAGEQVGFGALTTGIDLDGERDIA